MIEGGFFYARRTTIFLDYGSRNRGRKPRKPAIIRPMTIPSELLRQCWFLAGPTASGKTATSIELAKRLNGEVLSLDSMAIYRRMDIGTAKPTVEERAGIPHHLIDIVDPHEEFSTADFLNHAEQAIRDILSRNKTPIFAGERACICVRCYAASSKVRPPTGITVASWKPRKVRRPVRYGPSWSSEIPPLLPDCTPMTSDGLFVPLRCII